MRIYGGIAAVLVWGIGLLAVGKTWSGVFVLVMGAVAMAVALSSTLGAKALFVAIGALICTGLFAYRAGSNELTGKAIYYRSVGTRAGRSEPVTRKDSPAKFREATDFLWAESVGCLLVGIVAFNFYRKFDASADDF